MGFAENIRIADGPVLWAACATGIAGLLYLLRPHSGWKRAHPLHAWAVPLAALLLSVVLVLGVHWFLVYAVALFPDVLPPEVLAWSVPAVAGLLLALHRGWVLRRTRPRPARPGFAITAAAAAVAGVLVLSAAQINAYFGLNHTVSDLTGAAVARIPALEHGLQRQPGERTGVGLAGWTPPATLPAAGLVRKASIPGTVSGFRSRDAYVYLPPAYQAAPRPALPRAGPVLRPARSAGGLGHRRSPPQPDGPLRGGPPRRGPCGRCG